jgi:hypothetical protein
MLADSRYMTYVHRGLMIEISPDLCNRRAAAVVIFKKSLNAKPAYIARRRGESSASNSSRDSIAPTRA